ncbi:hypothetical protein HOO65_040574 [Ceratocystis lukuohia]|uniref:PD-(D/E)XK nuclease-like domain-containing protein n=1 Tax=Ceratocystis lukuohia TaxID=2019550 RepID=A0ABR4MIX2_9PEZI
MRSELITSWVDDVADACRQLTASEQDAAIWKPSLDQQAHAESALTSLVWSQRPQRKPLATSSQNHPSVRNGSSPVNIKRSGTPSSVSGLAHSKNTGVGAMAITSAIRITPSPDPETFADFDESPPAGVSIALPVGLRGQNSGILRQKASQGSSRPSHPQGAALSSLRREFSKHEIVNPSLLYKPHMKFGGMRSIETLLDLDDDDEEDEDDDRYIDEGPQRSAADTNGSSPYNLPYQGTDNYSRSHHAASSDVLGGPSKPPIRSLAPSPAAVRSNTRTTNTHTNVCSPVPNSSHAAHRPVPLRTILETLAKPLRWNDSTHDIRQRARILAATDSRHSGLLNLVKALTASAGDFHNCQLPHEVALLFEDDEQIPADAFTDSPFTAIDALPGLVDALAEPVTHNQSMSLISVQTSAAMAVFQHSQINDIVQATHYCRDTETSSYGWGDSVYMPLLRLAIGQTKGVRAENVASATMLESLAPTTLSKAMPTPRRPGDPVPLMMDYALTLCPSQLATDSGAQVQRRLQSLLRQKITVGDPSINHSMYGPLCKSPIAAFIAITAPSHGHGQRNGAPTNIQLTSEEGPVVALSQLGLSLTSWYRHITSFCKCSYQKACCTGPMFMPLLRVSGDAWSVTLVANTDDDFEVLPAINIGSTDTVTGIYRLLEALRHVVEWIRTDYTKWLSDFLDQHY